MRISQRPRMGAVLLLGIAAAGMAVPDAAGRDPSPPRAAARPREEVAIDELLGLMRRRLMVMHDVARAKWNTKAPISDPAREKVLLRDVAEKGKKLGLDPDATRAFFEAQIEAAKLIQEADFRRWKSESRAPFDDPPDLKRDLRPRIDALNADLLGALAKAGPLSRGREDLVRRLAEKTLSRDRIDAEVRNAAIRPLIRSEDKASTK